MFCYSVYGLRLASTFPLPELLTGRPPIDAQVRLGELLGPPAHKLAQGFYARVSAEEIYLYWDDLGALAVRNGQEIILDLIPGVPVSEVRLAVLGPALALLLHQRGLTVLHASGVVMDGGAVLFLGNSGWGKSTSAAAFYAQGYGMVADDLIPLQFNNSLKPMVYPGFPQLRLSPEVAAVLGATTGPWTGGPEQKCHLRAEWGFPKHPVPLQRLYVLAEGENLAIESIRAPEALIELVRHTYRIDLLHPLKGSANFSNCAHLVRQVPVRRLQVPRSLAALPDLVQLVKADLQEAARRAI